MYFKSHVWRRLAVPLRAATSICVVLYHFQGTFISIIYPRHGFMNWTKQELLVSFKDDKTEAHSN